MRKSEKETSKRRWNTPACLTEPSTQEPLSVRNAQRKADRVRSYPGVPSLIDTTVLLPGISKKEKTDQDRMCVVLLSMAIGMHIVYPLVMVAGDPCLPAASHRRVSYHALSKFCSMTNAVAPACTTDPTTPPPRSRVSLSSTLANYFTPCCVPPRAPAVKACNQRSRTVPSFADSAPTPSAEKTPATPARAYSHATLFMGQAPSFIICRSTPLTLVTVRWRLPQPPLENWSFFAPSNSHSRNTVIKRANRSMSHSSGSKGAKAFKRST